MERFCPTDQPLVLQMLCRGLPCQEACARHTLLLPLPPRHEIRGLMASARAQVEGDGASVEFRDEHNHAPVPQRRRAAQRQQSLPAAGVAGLPEAAAGLPWGGAAHPAWVQNGALPQSDGGTGFPPPAAAGAAASPAVQWGAWSGFPLGPPPPGLHASSGLRSPPAASPAAKRPRVERPAGAFSPPRGTKPSPRGASFMPGFVPSPGRRGAPSGHEALLVVAAAAERLSAAVGNHPAEPSDGVDCAKGQRGAGGTPWKALSAEDVDLSRSVSADGAAKPADADGGSDGCGDAEAGQDKARSPSATPVLCNQRSSLPSHATHWPSLRAPPLGR